MPQGAPYRAQCREYPIGSCTARRNLCVLDRGDVDGDRVLGLEHIRPFDRQRPEADLVGPWPMVVIFAGAIDGFLASGIIGLFVGSAVLALGYTLFTDWLKDTRAGPAEG